MHNKIKKAYNDIHASEDLKLKTINYISEKTNGYNKKIT